MSVLVSVLASVLCRLCRLVDCTGCGRGAYERIIALVTADAHRSGSLRWHQRMHTGSGHCAGSSGCLQNRDIALATADV